MMITFILFLLLVTTSVGQDDGTNPNRTGVIESDEPSDEDNLGDEPPTTIASEDVTSSDVEDSDALDFKSFLNTTHPVRHGKEADDFWHEDINNGTEHCHCGCQQRMTVAERWWVIKWALALDVLVAFAYFIGMVICVKYYGLENPSNRFIFAENE